MMWKNKYILNYIILYYVSDSAPSLQLKVSQAASYGAAKERLINKYLHADLFIYLLQ